MNVEQLNKQSVMYFMSAGCSINKEESWWAGVRRRSPGGVISHKEMMTTPRYASMAADFIRSTGLIGQYQALDAEQREGFARV